MERHAAPNRRATGRHRELQGADCSPMEDPRVLDPISTAHDPRLVRPKIKGKTPRRQAKTQSPPLHECFLKSPSLQKPPVRVRFRDPRRLDVAEASARERRHIHPSVEALDVYAHVEAIPEHHRDRSPGVTQVKAHRRVHQSGAPEAIDVDARVPQAENPLESAAQYDPPLQKERPSLPVGDSGRTDPLLGR